MPRRSLVTNTSGCPARKPICASYAALPLAWRASAGSGAQSAISRRASALAVPTARSSTDGAPAAPFACVPPERRASPPSRRTRVSCSAKPVSLKVTAPCACASCGVSGVMRTSLPASVMRPSTLASRMRSMGRSSFRCSPASPLAVARSSACWMKPATGDARTMPSADASRPRPSASTSTRVLPRSAMPACTRVNCQPGWPCTRPLAFFTCMLLWSKISSPARSSSAGHAACSGGCSARGT